MSKRISGFISSMRNLDTSTLASLRFQIIKFIDFLTPGLLPYLETLLRWGCAVVSTGHNALRHNRRARRSKRLHSVTIPGKSTWSAVPNSTEIYRSLKETGGYAFTHVGQVKRTDGALFSTSEVAPFSPASPIFSLWLAAQPVVFLFAGALALA